MHQVKEIFLSKGEFVVFDGGLIHAGAAYDTLNIRLHLYLLGEGMAPEEDLELMK